nr:alpha/beta fold hydrolase [Novosphingobium piscinae]
MAIPAYLTLPVGRAAKGLPLVILPHGGPYGVRDHGDYDPDVQFLANRGYVVLQPQYRGSDSYGAMFERRGEAQWGRTMQDDIDDGMDWLAKRGIIDPARVCIVGISYGGYAALWGATRNPERYRCAVSFAGISDMPRSLKYQLNSFDDKQAREAWRQKVQGDPTFDLRTISPLFNIDRLKVPVMLLHGTDDQIVQPRQSRLYAEALKAAGKPYEYYEIPDEGHGYTTTQGAQLWYDKLDAFLAKYNPAP